MAPLSGVFIAEQASPASMEENDYIPQLIEVKKGTKAILYTESQKSRFYKPWHCFLKFNGLFFML